MDICLISRFFDLRNGGVGRYSMELAERLKDEKEVKLKTVSQDGGLPLGEGMSGYFSFTAFESLFKIPEADAYHALSPLEAIHAPSPLVVTFHDFIPMLYPEEIGTNSLSGNLERWFTSNYFEIACSIAVRKADAITAVSDQTEEELVSKFDVDRKKVKVIRHGINPNLKPEEKEDDTFRVGTLSFLGPRKRIDRLIEAFLNADVDGELLIGGRGGEEGRLKKIAGDDDRIKFLGFVPEEDINDFYNSLDVFVFPTHSEGYGLPAVEAMACKTPVATLSDAIIPGDIQSRTVVVESLEEWFENPEFEEIDLDENLTFAKEHDWKKCADKYMEIYHTL